MKWKIEGKVEEIIKDVEIPEGLTKRDLVISALLLYYYSIDLGCDCLELDVVEHFFGESSNVYCVNFYGSGSKYIAEISFMCYTLLLVYENKNKL